MRISNQVAPATPTSRAASRPAAANATPSLANDQWFSTDPQAVNVVSFNTAGDKCLNTPEDKIPDSALFQKVIQGSPDAPIVACQETVPVLGKKMQQLAKNGNFQVVWPGNRWLPNWLPTSQLMQGNMVLVPKRYKILKVEEHTYTGRWAEFRKALAGCLFHHKPLNDLVVALQKRGWESLYLQDSRTGKKLTVIATHVAYADKQRRVEEPQLIDAIHKAQRQGPTVVMGDFNTPTLDTNRAHDPRIVDFWKKWQAAGVADMGPSGEAGISNWEDHNNMDLVAASGFHAVSSQMLTGTKMTIPGRPDAEQVSDHFAEADSLAFDR